MGNIKITDLTAYTDPVNTDVLPIVDVTSDVTKKVSIANLMKNASLGTAAAPGIAFDGDPNTGIYSPGADQVALSTNGTGRLFVDASGNVGLSTLTPTSLGTNIITLEIKGAANGRSGGIRLSTSDNSQRGAFYIYEGEGILGTETSHPLGLYTNNTERLRITSAGLVGIGTSAPSQLLTLQQTSAGSAVDCLFLNNSSISNGTAVGISFGPNTTNDITRSAIIRGINESGGAGNATGLGFFTNADGTAPTQKVTITSGGNVGIGTTAPSARLQVGAGSADGVNLDFNGTIATGGEYSTLQFTASAYGFTGAEIRGIHTNGGINLGVLGFHTAGSERARIDSSGRLLVGTSTARSNFYNDTNSAFIQLESASNDGSALALIQNFNANTLGSQLILAKSNSASVGSNTLVASGDACGRITFQGNDGTQFVEAAHIRCHIDGTPGANDMPGRLVFSTTADGASSPTERMRITNSGNIGIGATSITNTAGFARVVEIAGILPALTLNQTDSGYVLAKYSWGVDSLGACGLWHNNTSTYRLVVEANGNVRAPGVYSLTTAVAADVRVDSSGYLYRSTSSIRYKKDVETLEDEYADAILNARPVWFRSLSEKDNPDWGHWGFIAEEVEQIDPRLCTYSTNEDGEQQVESVQYDRFVPHLLNLIKRQQQALETLEAKVAALESA